MPDIWFVIELLDLSECSDWLEIFTERRYSSPAGPDFSLEEEIELFMIWHFIHFVLHDVITQSCWGVQEPEIERDLFMFIDHQSKYDLKIHISYPRLK